MIGTCHADCVSRKMQLADICRFIFPPVSYTLDFSPPSQAGRFRRLTGTMSPPDDSKTAEIYVEGTRKMVEGFVRWCKKSNVGLSQVVTVTEITEADPTGLYDSFYCKTH
jgi:acylphosphatase